MKLYHFCSRHHLEGIKTDGLTLGIIPLSIDPPLLAKGFQWITSNPDFDQSWCKYSTLPYRRNEWRITVKIPKSHAGKKYRWLPLSNELAKHFPNIRILNLYGDPKNWFVFEGTIKPSWFRKIDANPESENLKTDIHLTAEAA